MQWKWEFSGRLVKWLGKIGDSISTTTIERENTLRWFKHTMKREQMEN